MRRKELQQELKERKENGETGLSIKNNEIISGNPNTGARQKELFFQQPFRI